MGKALYRKYRSRALDEIVGQPHITRTLKNTLENGTFSHAYLFTGPKGIGKTSIARILAHEVNKLPYDEDATHLDIIEIDAASNRRIDEIRELRDRVHIAPTSAKYKVYIIDEVHMLTKEAFNALLKTLEEPPAHVIFILATTEAHKLPETIISRTQRFTFKPVAVEAVVAHLQFIAKQESITISDDALTLIAQHGGGSFRDSISVLDQVRGHGDSVELKDVQAMLGIAPIETIDILISALQSSNPSSLLTSLSEARQQGYQAGQIAKQLAQRLRQYIINGSSPVRNDLITPTLQSLLNVPAAYDPNSALEVALLDVVLADGQTFQPTVVSTPEKPAPKVQKTEAVVEKIARPVSEPVIEEEPLSELITEVKNTQPFDNDAWSAILDRVKKTHNTLYSVARMATPQMDNESLILVFKFAFHQKRLNEVKNKQIISDIVNDVIGKPTTLTCVVGVIDDTPVVAVLPKSASKTSGDKTITNISNIFGGAEVLE